jgi:hypothetical protein
MYPDFLCIGAKKAGTSWLYQNLRAHPSIWLPPIKEVHYFEYRHYTRKDVLSRIITRERQHLLRAFGQLVRRNVRLSRADRMVLMRYIGRARSDLWYQSLFEPAQGRVTGDCTPDYARLNAEDIAYVHERMPHAKIIYLLRNPIERAWSHAVMRFSRSGRKLEEPWSDDLIWFLRSQADHPKQSDYLGNLDRWSRMYVSSQIFIGFLDEIAREPDRFLLRLFAFLGVEARAEYVPPTAPEKVFSRAGNVPSSVAGFLADLYRPSLIKLHERFDNEYTQAWLQYANRQSAASNGA